MVKVSKNRASKNAYVSPNQLTLIGFESPFSQTLALNNRWMILANKIPWNLLVSRYKSLKIRLNKLTSFKQDSKIKAYAI